MSRTSRTTRSTLHLCVLMGLLLVIAAAGCDRSAPGPVASSPPRAGHVTKILVVMEENETVAAYDGMPYLKSLSDRYGKATNYQGVRHPSLGNYLAIVSGQGATTCGLNNNPLPAACRQPGATVFGQALAAGGTAKSYAESMPGNCVATDKTPYAVRHNPWPYFVEESADCVKGNVPLGTTSGGQLVDDVRSGTLPNASMVVPNLDHDAHDGNLKQCDDWLAAWMPVLMSGADFKSGSLVIVVTFDEGIKADQNIPFVVVHPSQSHRVVAGRFDHYALTRLYDDILGVSPLNAAAKAPGLRAAFGL